MVYAAASSVQTSHDEESMKCHLILNDIVSRFICSLQFSADLGYSPHPKCKYYSINFLVYMLCNFMRCL